MYKGLVATPSGKTTSVTWTANFFYLKILKGFTARYYAECGYEIECRLSLRLSVRDVEVCF